MAITASLTGNLGNHMWIYAITRTVAEYNKYDWGFNPSPEFDYRNGIPQMDFMDIDYGITHNYKYNDTPPWIENEWRENYLHSQYFNGDSVDYHPFQPDIFEIKDNTKLYIRCCQDARYLNKTDVLKWFKIKKDVEKTYKENFQNIMIQAGAEYPDDLCVLNVRGGEYKGVQNLLLGRDYWWRAINFMLTNRNKKIKFVIISDDPQYAESLVPTGMKIPVFHTSIGGDYYVINNARNLILSNSSFAIFPTWLNEHNPYVIAPRYWARHNISTGYWANSDIWTFGWLFLDREDGKLHDR